VKVNVRYFSIFKDITGKSEEQIELGENIKNVGEFLHFLVERYPKMSEWVKNEEIIVLIDGKVYNLDEKIPPQIKEIGIMPPISGGDNYGFIDKIEPEKLLKSVLALAGEDIGAVTVFVGRVKGVVNGRKVFSLFYETYEPYSSRSLGKIIEEEKKKIGFSDAFIYHKRGEAVPGEPVLFISVISPSRKEAIEGLASLLERVKHEAYVWKLEKREDGEYWILGDGKRVERKATKN